MDIVTLLAGLLLGLALGGCAGLLWARSRPTGGLESAQVAQGLTQLREQLAGLDRARALGQGQLGEQVERLRREAETLSTALSRPHVRGQWGELHLRRTVEAAGMAEHCDFTEQLHLEGADGALRPDLVVHLTGGRSIAVDAKTPLDAYLEAVSAETDEQQALLARHARQLRGHVDALSSRSYWSRLPDSPDFVVLFVPSESCLAAALGADPPLIEYAAARHVVLASPTTLIALLRTVAHGWTTQRLVDSTREIHELGRELHARLARMGGHLARLGRALGSSVEAYNRTVGALESRVLVTARQFEDIGLGVETLPRPEGIGDSPRQLTAAELLEEATPQREQLPSDVRRGDDEPPEGRSTVSA